MGRKLRYPGKFLSVLIPLLGFSLLIAVFRYGLEDHPLTYASYVLAFYSLTVVIANSIPLMRNGMGLYGRVKSTGIFHISRSLIMSLAINVIYSGYHLIKDGKEYKIRNRTEQMVQALKSGLNHPAKDIEAEVAAIYDRKAAMQGRHGSKAQNQGKR